MDGGWPLGRITWNHVLEANGRWNGPLVELSGLFFDSLMFDCVLLSFFLGGWRFDGIQLLGLTG